MINRIIKVKAWHKDLKEFVQASKYVVIDKDGVVYPSYAVTLLEFTGLKDDEGKEIYEGDLLKVVYNSTGFYYGEVVFHEGSFCLKLTKVPKKKNQYDVGQTPELNNFEWSEVIGNIYEVRKS